MDRIRVAMLIHGYYPRVGGAERIVGSIVPRLQAKGVDVHILTRRLPGTEPFEEIDGVPVHRLPVPGPKVAASLSYTLSGLRLIRQIDPDLIHAHELISPSTTAVTAKRLFGMPVVATPHRSGYIGDVQKMERAPLGKRRLASFVRHVDMFMAISREIDQELAVLGVEPERRVLIPNGVDVDRFVPLPAGAKTALRASLGISGGPVAMFAGRYSPEKCLDSLVAVWPAVREQHPEAQLLLLGAGPEEDQLKQASGEGVVFPGRVDDVTPYLQAADMFVLPSTAEGLSVALLEAMATGLAVVATRVGGAPDIITQAENGWLIPPDDRQALQEALLTVLGPQVDTTELGRRARQHVVAEYSLPHIVDRWLGVYRKLLVPEPIPVHNSTSETAMAKGGRN